MPDPKFERQRKYMRTSQKYKKYRAQYDRKRLQKIKLKHAELVEKLGSHCFICLQTKPLMHIHHLTYPEGYLEPNSAHAQWKFLMEVEKNPENFRLVCAWCHGAIAKVTQNPIILTNLQKLKRM